MRTEIYYFSGTGNSFFAANALAQELNAALIPIASLRDKACIETDAQIIGIVFPVYYFEPPMIVEEFARKLKGIKAKYVFAVCTYGGASGATIRMLKSVIRLSGGVLSAAYGLCMPQNSFPKRNENREKKQKDCERTLGFIAKSVQVEKRGVFYSNILLELMLIPIHAMIIRPACKRHFQAVSNLPPASTYAEHKHAMDIKFQTNENCNGCGICTKVCPVGNIMQKDGKPVWLHRCEHCLACYNWCPHQAIQGGITTKGYYYRHPKIKLQEIMQQVPFKEIP